MSQFEKNACSTNDTDEGSEGVSTSNWIKNCQGVFVKKKHQPKQRKKDNKLRYNPSNDEKIKGDPHRTIFVARLNFNTTEDTLFEIFGRYGSVDRLRLVKDVKTGKSKGYAFVEFSDDIEAKRALREERLLVDGTQVLVDRVRAGVIPSWLPRRLGGGLGQRQRGTQRFAWRLAYFGDTSRVNSAELHRKQQLWQEHNRRSMKIFS